MSIKVANSASNSTESTALLHAIALHSFLLAIIALALLFIATSVAHAGPYLAIQQGLKCAFCHVNPSDLQN